MQLTSDSFTPRCQTDVASLFRRSTLVLLVFVSVVCGLNAQVLISVNISDTSAVTFTATGSLPAVNFTPAAGTNFPIRLIGFFTSNPGVTTLAASTSTLTTVDAGHFLDSALTGRAIPGYTSLVLRHTSSDQETFTTSSPGFTGYATYDLSTLLYIPTAGSTGNIVVSDGTNTAVVGTYSVTATAVPEPSTYAMIFGLVALAGTFVIRRRRLSV